tara:strand:- start:1177 stop:1626 length:450 start_codon:yes stop_codon:yes gene_type:complete
MNLKYNKTSNSKKDGSYVEYEITDNNTKIGEIEGAGNNKGEFFSIININSNYQKKGIGFKAYIKVYDEINLKFPIKTIVCSWDISPIFQNSPNGMSSNLLMFLNNEKNGIAEKDNIYSTPTGKWMTKLGFKLHQIVNRNNTQVKIHFKK